MGARELDRARGGLVDRRGDECVAGDMQTVAGEPPWVEVVGTEQRRRAPIRGHRPFTIRAHERDDDSCTALDRSDRFDTTGGEVGGDPGTRSIVTAPYDATCLAAERRDPRADIGGLSACGGPRLRVPLRPRRGP